MTGTLVVKGVKSHQYRSFKVDNSDWPPKYWKVLLDLEGDVSVAFSDSRRFARVRLQEAPADHEPVSLLGFDPVLSMPSLPEFIDLIKGQKRSLKALLLDQVSSLRPYFPCPPGHAACHADETLWDSSQGAVSRLVCTFP